MSNRRRLLCASIPLALWLATSATHLSAEEKGEAGDELVKMVLTLLSDKDKDVRAVGLEQVRTEAKGATATKEFAARLQKLPSDAQVGLLAALADRGDAAARPAVLDVLKATREESVRVAAIRAIGALGGAGDLPLLIELLASGSKAEKSAARSGLVSLRGEDVPAAIVRQLSDSPVNIRVALIEVLTTRRALETIPELLRAANDAEPAVRTAAMHALGKLAGPEQIPAMVQAVLKSQPGPERDTAEKSLMLVCGRIEDADQRADPLLTAMQDLNAADRVAMLSTLGRVGGPAALKTIEAAIADPDRHETGLRALCNWPDASISSRLIELAKTDKHPKHRALALAALIRVAPLPDKRSAAERLELLQTVMKMCARETDQNQVLKRARAIRTIETLHFIKPYLDQPQFAQTACETTVELAHHRTLREPNKAEFDQVLDKVIETSKDATVVERAKRYKKGQTWAKPTPAE